MLPSTGSLPLLLQLCNRESTFDVRHRNIESTFPVVSSQQERRVLLSGCNRQHEKKSFLSFMTKRTSVSELRRSHKGRKKISISPPSSFVNDEEERKDNPTPLYIRSIEEDYCLLLKEGRYSSFSLLSANNKDY